MALDLGFNGFLEKFEDHFGRSWTKVLLILIGLAIASVCVGVIWQYIIAPVAAFIEVPGRLDALARMILAGVTIVLGATIALGIYDWYLGRKLGSRARSRKALEAQVQATEELLDSLERKRREQLQKRRAGRSQP